MQTSSSGDNIWDGGRLFAGTCALSFDEFARAVKWIWRPTNRSEGLLGASDVLHPIEIMCYGAVKFGLVILGPFIHSRDTLFG